ncbi:MAG: hypothetical protein ACOC0Q_04510 [Wenzhouxiangella sp.]
MLTIAGDLVVFAGGSAWWQLRGRASLLSYRRFLAEGADAPR